MSNFKRYTRANVAATPGVETKDSKYFIEGKQIIPEEDVQEFLRVYSDPANPGAGAGWNRLYATLKLKYTGIQQVDVQEFLRSVSTHQQVHQVHGEHVRHDHHLPSQHDH